MDQQGFEVWVQGYIRAWQSNAPQDIRSLFATHARYRTGPFDAPWDGRDAIVDQWIRRQDDFGNVRFSYEILAVNEQVGVLQGWTTYLRPRREYSNIWVVHFNNQGECTEFTEWWIERRV